MPCNMLACTSHGGGAIAAATNISIATAPLIIAIHLNAVQRRFAFALSFIVVGFGFGCGMLTLPLLFFRVCTFSPSRGCFRANDIIRKNPRIIGCTVV